MSDRTAEIQEIVDRETRAWSTLDADLLLSVLHPDMVWPWPPHSQAHDPLDWVIEWGRYNAERWRRGWQRLFDTHALIHNRRGLAGRRSAEGDGAFAVVDVDTLWREQSGRDFHWLGRACKIYTLMAGGVEDDRPDGLLEYPRGRIARVARGDRDARAGLFSGPPSMSVRSSTLPGLRMAPRSPGRPVPGIRTRVWKTPAVERPGRDWRTGRLATPAGGKPSESCGGTRQTRREPASAAPGGRSGGFARR